MENTTTALEKHKSICPAVDGFGCHCDEIYECVTCGCEVMIGNELDGYYRKDMCKGCEQTAADQYARSSWKPTTPKYLIRYTIVDDDTEYDDRFLCDSNKMEDIVRRIFPFLEDEEVKNTVKQYDEKGEIWFPGGDRIYRRITIEPVSVEDLKVLEKYL